MMGRIRLATACAVAIVGIAAAGSADASLNVFETYNGTYGLSTDGGGSTASSYALSAFVPIGATVTAAYLYQATYGVDSAQGVSLNGNALTFTNFVGNATACCSLASSRADVTSIIASVVNGGTLGTYNFTVGEENSAVTDGTALVVVYSLASLATNTVALLDGFASVGGDVTSVNFADPLAPAAPGFVADLRLGIGFSCCNQASTVSVNGTTITTVAGNNDDSSDASAMNGSLITVGGNDDPYSTFLPTYANDHERYDLTPYINDGDTSLTIRTSNSSRDDNIFFAGLVISGTAGVNAPPPSVPEPASWMMMIGGFGLIGAAMRRMTGSLLTA